MAPRSDPAAKGPIISRAEGSQPASEDPHASGDSSQARQRRPRDGRAAGESGSYDDWTLGALQRRAKERGVDDHASTSRKKLIKALRKL